MSGMSVVLFDAQQTHAHMWTEERRVAGAHIMSYLMPLTASALTLFTTHAFTQAHSTRTGPHRDAARLLPLFPFLLLFKTPIISTTIIIINSASPLHLTLASTSPHSHTHTHTHSTRATPPTGTLAVADQLLSFPIHGHQWQH